MMALAPVGVSLHFHRMVARGTPGALDGQDERNRSMVESLDDCVEMLAMVQPNVIIVAHTATSYYLGKEREAELLAGLGAARGVWVATAFAGVGVALQRLGGERMSIGAPD